MIEQPKRVPGLQGEEKDITNLILEGLSGKKYYPATMTAGRLPAWEKAWLKAQWGMNPQEIFRAVLNVAEALKRNNVYDASVRIHALLEGAARVADGKPHWMIELFCCFFNAEGEDIAKLDEEMIKVKYDDLKHYSVDDLFILAGMLIPSFLNDYSENKKTISDNLETLKPAAPDGK
jgi:hypothetical protein